MKQYLDLLENIQKNGTYKPAAREGMPGTKSLFGHQFRHDLSEGFPLLTTKKMYWKGVVVELLWFLRGDTNIKYLVDNGVNIWNEDAYNYYKKKCKEQGVLRVASFYEFVEAIKEGVSWSQLDEPEAPKDYKLGDCGHQYGKVWRDFNGKDQISTLIDGLKNGPESRRHLVTALDPANDHDLALYWCHALFQFNCRPLSAKDRLSLFIEDDEDFAFKSDEEIHKFADKMRYPKYALDCQLYQRSADTVLGVPFNIASYALLTHILAKICNMFPGEYIHTFGDVHVYDNHKEAVLEQLGRTPTSLPTLNIDDSFEGLCEELGGPVLDLQTFTEEMDHNMFTMLEYYPQDPIKAKLSTGLQ